MKTSKLISSLVVCTLWKSRRNAYCLTKSQFDHVRYTSTYNAAEWITKSLKEAGVSPPVFRVPADKIKVLYGPDEFYNELIQRTRKAQDRITLASLYLGNGKLEEKLVGEIYNSLSENKDLRLKVLLEYTRGTRGKKNSRTMLLPTLQRFTDRSALALYHTPNLRGLKRALIPERFNETINVQHVKTYLFDDTLILSGANLSNDYFTNRQDRYIIFEDCKEISDYFDGLVSALSEISFHVLPNSNDVQLCTNTSVHPYKESKKRFNQVANETLTLFKDKFSSYVTTDIEPTNDGDTLVMPFLQMKTFNIDEDERVTAKLLKNSPIDSSVCLATAYFNVTDEYWNSILSSDASYDVIMAHPKAMGFFGASGMAGGIPNAYNLIAQRRFDQVVHRKQDCRIKLKEYYRENWTFHGKGLWAEFPGQHEPSLTLIGSPNFGKRSVYRDIEAQVAIVTFNNKLKEEFRKERDNMLAHARDVCGDTFNEKERRAAWWVYIAATFMNDQF